MTSLFHKFIEVAASKPPQADTIIQFAYMEQEIRKNYKQVKTTKGVQKPNDDFVDYWKEIGNLGRQEQMSVYFRWIELLEKAIGDYTVPELPDKEAQLYIKKSLISKWEPRKVQLQRCTMQIFSKKLKLYPLKCFCIRKSKNKDHFSWVMEVVMQVDDKDKIKSFHLGSNNIGQFQDWYREVERRIDLARIEYFQQLIASDHKINISPTKNIQNKELMENKIAAMARNELKSARMKTFTQLAIDKHMKHIEDIKEDLTVIEDNEKQNKLTEVHPNIFVRMFPGKNIEKFCQTPQEGQLLECQKQYRLYDLGGVIKIFVTLNRSIDVVFRGISESHKNWNPQINVFNIKNKISSENSIFVYQKDKSLGLLYRQRDYFFLRHCFSLATEDKRDKLFMIEKSIDSIHNPPFMTVARGQKQLVWCVSGSKQEKQSLLVVEGLIKGGGYMNISEDKDNTVKYFKKLLQLDNYLKEIELAKPSKDGYLFVQDWLVTLKEQSIEGVMEDDEFYSPRQIGSDEFKSNHPEQLSAKKQSQMLTPIKHEEQFHEFMKQTSDNRIQEVVQLKSDPILASESFVEEYQPPKFDKDNSVIIPQNYLNKKHQIKPNQKGKSLFVEPFRGHHLWKGEWAVSESGGLNYIDKEKMKQQRGVLTFIIKRIGKNILSGKGILNVSLPVDIFCRESNIQRLAMSFGYCPLYLQKVVNSDPIEQLKAILSSVMGSSLIYLTMEKPFNPILGETYQCWIDGCPVYFEQIAHHPPVASYLMIGRGYKLYGTMEAKMDLSINSGTGVNEGIFTVQFDSGSTFHFTTPPGQLSGLTYGERKLCLVDKTYFWSMQEGIFLEIVYNPLSKQSRFFGGNGKTFVGEQRLADYFEGIVRKYRPQDLKEHLTPKKGSIRKLMAMPKALPNQQPLAELGKIHGRWTKHIYYDQQKIFDADTTFHLGYRDEKNPLPSHSNYREDIVYRRLNEYVLSQEWKEILEVKQRRDRKLREDFAKKRK